MIKEGKRQVTENRNANWNKYGQAQKINSAILEEPKRNRYPDKKSWQWNEDILTN